MDALPAFALAFGVVALAELGDKSQLVVLAQAGRAPPLRVVLEASAAFALLSAVAVLAGATVARFAPPAIIALASGALFLAFGVLALAAARRPRPDEERPARPGGTFVLVLVSELGDKTQLATAALAASTGQALATGLGSWLAESLLAGVAVLAGAWLSRRMAPRRRALASAVLFLALGVATLAWAVWRLAS